MLKKIVAAALIPACSVPIALSGSEEKKIIDLSDIKKPRLNYQKDRTVKGFVSFIKKAGYSRKPKESLVDFNSGRGVNVADNTGLGCYRTIFGGKNYLRFQDPETYQISWYHSRTFDLNEEGPIIACATAAGRKTSTNSGVYELEFAVKKGNEGFVEKIFIFEDWIISQLVKFEKNFGSNAKEHPYVHTIGFQRNIRKNEITKKSKEWKWQISNPENGSWQDLNLNDVKEKKSPIFYSVWVEENSGKGIFENLGVKDKEDKWFSGLISENKTQETNRWFGSFYSQSNNPSTLSHTRNQFHFYKYKHLANVARTLEKTKGSWKGIKEFCSLYENERDRSKKLSVPQQIQLQEYCYHKK